MGMLSWDIKKQHEAEKWLSSVCVHPIPICSEPTQNWFFWRPFSDPGKTEAEYAEFTSMQLTNQLTSMQLTSIRLDSEV